MKERGVDSERHDRRADPKPGPGHRCQVLTRRGHRVGASEQRSLLPGVEAPERPSWDGGHVVAPRVEHDWVKASHRRRNEAAVHVVDGDDRSRLADQATKVSAGSKHVESGHRRRPAVAGKIDRHDAETALDQSG